MSKHVPWLSSSCNYFGIDCWWCNQIWISRKLFNNPHLHPPFLVTTCLSPVPFKQSKQEQDWLSRAKNIPVCKVKDIISEMEKWAGDKILFEFGVCVFEFCFMYLCLELCSWLWRWPRLRERLRLRCRLLLSLERERERRLSLDVERERLLLRSRERDLINETVYSFRIR